MSRNLLIGAAAAAAAFAALGVMYNISKDGAAMASSEQPKKRNHITSPNTSQSPSPASTSSSSVPSDSLLLNGTSSSASSKVLLTGGYLILEPEYSGLVLALSARFHAQVFSLPGGKGGEVHDALGITLEDHESGVPIIVYAPQRATKPLRYFLTWSEKGETWTLKPSASAAGQEQNKFVEMTILYTLLYLSNSSSSTITTFNSLLTKLSTGLLIYLEGDFPFYTASLPSSLTGGRPAVVPDGSKTGLGSSAALVASLVTALITHFAPESLHSAVTHESHNLAQFIHCAAQGKVGSGFDISTAFYGSQIYQRFRKEVIADLVERASNGYASHSTAAIPSAQMLDVLTSAASWNNTRTSFHLPPGLVLILADVEGGASTPTMVKQVLKWREDREKSEMIWTQLAKANQTVQSLFEELTKYASEHPNEYHATRQLLARSPGCKWDSIDSSSTAASTPSFSSDACSLFTRLYSSFYAVRHWLRQLGSATGADIEPVDQTQLLDQTILEAGVLIAGVPGAGGNDAIFAVLIDDSITQKIETTWTQHKFPDAHGHVNQQRKVRRLPVEEEKENIRRELCTRDIANWKFEE